jgi:hypothetical protein
MDRRAVLRVVAVKERDFDAEYRAMTLAIRNIGNFGARGCRWEFVLSGDVVTRHLVRLVEPGLRPIEGGLQLVEGECQVHYHGLVDETIYPAGEAFAANIHVHKSQSEFSLLYRLLFDDGPYPDNAFAAIWYTRNAQGMFEQGDLLR